MDRPIRSLSHLHSTTALRAKRRPLSLQQTLKISVQACSSIVRTSLSTRVPSCSPTMGRKTSEGKYLKNSELGMGTVKKPSGHSTIPDAYTALFPKVTRARLWQSYPTIVLLMALTCLSSATSLRMDELQTSF